MIRKGLLVLTICVFGHTAVHAGSTGTTALHTPQGNQSSTAFGDYVSDDGALTTFYRYFVEVPSGISRLSIDLFDADFGAGGATEDTAGRDRERTAYNTTVTYSLLDPSGTTVTPRFTTGNATSPTGADNAWLSFYDATGNTVRDNFGTAAFTNNDGNNNWSAAWIESDGGGAGAGAGAIQVTGGELRIQDGVAGTPSIQREADLLGSPGLSLTQAFLTFDYRTSNTLEDGDTLNVDVSSNGGTSWTTLESFSNDSSGSRSYNISAFIANNTRIRFIITGGTSGDEFYFFDNVQITDGTKTAGHWELRISQISGGDDINAIGIRAHDGTSGSGGTELNVYADSMLPPGVNPPGSGTNTRSYTLYPYITAGCSCSKNDFDFDSDSGNVGSMSFTSPTGAFVQSYTTTSLSADDTWRRDTFSGWTSDNDALDYGIWTMAASIISYLAPGPNGNYSTFYMGNFTAAANPPTANPIANTFRIYLPTDAGAAPLKPYLEQELAWNRNVSGPSPPQVGQTTTFTVTVRLVNPTAHSITFSAANLVTTNVPGSGAVYGGSAQVSQGSMVSQPAVNGTGNITWNPGTLTAGSTAILAYDVRVTPTSAGQRIPITATPASGNGSRARYVDETGNTTQARATYQLGPICELAVTQGLATEVLLSSFRTERGAIEWTTASEAGTIGFNVYRLDGSRVNASLIPASRGGRYRLDDPLVAGLYILEEITATGRSHRYGPLSRIERPTPRVSGGAQSVSRPRRAVVSNAKPERPKALMIGVDRTGIVRITAGELASHFGKSLGSIESSVRRGEVAITSMGRTVAWTASGDAILFLGEKSDSIYSKERVYRLELERGTTMKSVNVTPASASPLSTFTSTRDVETDVFPASALPLDPESDFWFWDFVVSGDATLGRKTFAVEAPSLVSASGASLQIRVQGAIADAAHGARISVNGVPIGEIAWSSLDAHAATLTIPAGVLAASNEVAIEGVLDPAASFDVFYIDGFALQYERFASPDDGQLEITRGGTIAASSFTSAPVTLDITNRLRPALLTGAAFAGGTTSFVTPAATQAVFLADTFLAPSFVRGSGESVLKKKLRADYIVVAPRSVRDAADALASLRERDDLDTFVAELEQIYDEFNGGNPSPHAIRAFLSQARPRYAVLAGTGTYDYRGVELGPGLVPPFLMKTANGLFAADSLYADGNGDALPDFAIGRIPVSSADELSAYVEKLRTNAVDDEAPILFSADAVDQSADFRAASVRAEEPFASRPSVRVYLDDMTPTAARDALISAWQNGTPLLSWVGHGGLDQLGASAILTAADAPALTSSGPLPVVVAMTCTINRFEDGLFEPLGAALTRVDAAGALAVWSASGLSVHGDAAELQRTFLRLAAQTPGARVGDLVVRSLAAHPSETAGIYLLLGDPAVRLSLPLENDNAGQRSRSGE